MVSFPDIMKLRKAGRLREAYLGAEFLLQEDSEDVWAKRAMMWVVYDYAKQNTAVDKRVNFLRCIRQLAVIGIPNDEDVFYDNMVILIRNVIRKCVGDYSSSIFVTDLWRTVQQFDFAVPGEAYSGLLQSFIKVKDQWTLFPDFCEWWNFDNLRDEDFKQKSLPEGKKDLPLAEKAFMAYSKSMWRIGDKNRIRAWLPVMEKLMKQYDSYVFLPYYYVKLCLLIGETGEAVKFLKPLVEKKEGEFWLWELIGDASESKRDRLSAYSKAMLCKAPEKMTVALREKVAFFLMEESFKSEAKREFDEVVRIRQENKWRISERVVEVMGTEEFLNLKPVSDNCSFYKSNSQTIEEKYIGVLTVEIVRVTHINDSKCFVSFETKNKKSGFFRERSDKRRKTIERGDMIEIRALKIETHGPTRVKSWRKVAKQ